MRPLLHLSICLTLIACDGATDTLDADGDGWSVDSDCDDGDAAIHPDALERCDEIDGDCDGRVDEGVASVWYLDGDGDGYGAGDAAVEACAAPDGRSAVAGDCDDGDADIHPSAEEVCDGLDNDCDGFADDDDPDGVVDGAEGYLDTDGDGLGGDYGLWCESIARGGDCDDNDPSVPQGDAWYADGDGDGYGDASSPVDPCETDDYVTVAGDCDDGDDTIHPDALERCEPAWIDEDCDGVWDGDDPDSDCFRYELTVSLAEAAAFSGEFSSDKAGYAVAGVGDVDGDGLDDLLIGAPDNDVGGADAGAAYLVLGPSSGSSPLSVADARFFGDSTGVIGSSGDDVGYAVAGAGDVNADGYADLLVGAPQDDEGYAGSGTAYLVLGPVSGEMDLDDADAVLVGPNGGARAGHSLAGAGDMDGDGYDDVFIGATGARDASGDATGAAFLVTGPASGEIDLGSADAALIGEASRDNAGYSVDGVGDVNGDGLHDLLIGAHSADRGGIDSGAAYLIPGPVSGALALADAEATLIGAAPGDAAGSSVTDAGDVDGDGLDDLLIGAHGVSSAGENSGAAYLVLAGSLASGDFGLGTADAVLQGEMTYDAAGAAVAGAGDVDGDGFDDVVVGAPYHSSGGAYAGAAYLVLGPITGTLGLAEADFKLVGTRVDGYAGYSVAGAGDMDSDGLDDLLVGAYGANTAYLVLGGNLIP